MRVGVLTGGGDCPGLNAVIRGIVRKGVQEYGYDFVGFRDGWRGPWRATPSASTSPAVLRASLPRGGTILGSSRTNPLKVQDGIRRIKENLAKQEIRALVAIGGEDTLGVAARLSGEYGVPCVGVPKTIDNDLSATDYTFGFDTAVNIATEAIDRLHTTAESHMRVLVVEVMGRHAGWIAPALRAWPAAPTSSSSRSSASTSTRSATGSPPASGRRTRRSWSSPRGPCRRTATWSSGTSRWTPSGTSGSPGSASGSPRRSRSAPGREARTTVLGHVQRGGTPSAFDRWLATRFGLHAIDAVHEGDFGTMVALRGYRHRPRPDRRGHRPAEDGRPEAVRGGRGLLRLTAAPEEGTAAPEGATGPGGYTVVRRS